MTGTRGRFEKGVWVEEPIPDEAEKAGTAEKTPMDSRIQEVSADVSGTINKVVSLAKDLFTTKEGRKHIQTKIDGAANQLDSAIKDFISESEKVFSSRKGEEKQEKKQIKVE